jgi:hypothetical protein
MGDARADLAGIEVAVQREPLADLLTDTVVRALVVARPAAGERARPQPVQVGGHTRHVGADLRTARAWPVLVGLRAALAGRLVVARRALGAVSALGAAVGSVVAGAIAPRLRKGLATVAARAAGRLVVVAIVAAAGAGLLVAPGVGLPLVLPVAVGSPIRLGVTRQ